jgi:hypothetical protein
MEVLKIMAHLLVTLFLIVSYVLLVFVKGDHDVVLQNILVIAVGYWFGAVTLGSKSNDNSK